MKLVGDVGGTWIRFAIADADGRLSHQTRRSVYDFESLAQAAGAYLAAVSGGGRVRQAALGVPGPVNRDEIRLTNLPRYNFGQAELRGQLGLERLLVVNDAAANAASIPALRRMGAVIPVGGGQVDEAAPFVVIGPGTGLGISYSTRDAQGVWSPHSTEGGNIGLALADAWLDLTRAIDEEDLRAWGGFLSAEFFLSGPGIVRLHRAYSTLGGVAFGASRAEEVTGRAGEDALCARATQAFIALLGSFAGDQALSFGAYGGVYLVGSIVSALRPQIEAGGFRAAFEAKGRYTDYMRTIPTGVVDHEWPALVGLAQLLADPIAGGAAAPPGPGRPIS